MVCFKYLKKVHPYLNVKYGLKVKNNIQMDEKNQFGKK